MVHVYISGHVQGIGFRQFLKSKATKLGIKGWVKNLPDGRVEAAFTGQASDIEKMVEFCKRGPFLAQVKDLLVEEVDDTGLEIFEIIRE